MNASVDSIKFGIEQNNYVDVLVENYLKQKQNLIALHAAFDETSPLCKSIVGNFGTKFKPLENSLHLLNVHFWGEVYKRSNIEMFLDTNKRQKWSEDLYVSESNKADLPEFTHENIISTVKSWYESRNDFFLERVDLVFQSLSGSHATNEPQGFGRKMIFNNVCCNIFSTPTDMRLTTRITEILYDLASVIATVLNIPAPPYSFKNGIDRLHTGEKIPCFGGSFEVQVFKNGNIHVWVHPEIAIELNLWLAKKYPSAIAAQYRTKPTTVKEFTYKHDYLTNADFDILNTIKHGNSLHLMGLNNAENKSNGNLQAIERFSKFTGLELDQVLNLNKRSGFGAVANEILRNGYPNIKDYQFYPTPIEITEAISNHLNDSYSLDALEQMVMLEPSAGTGRIAKLHPNYPTKSHCVEISPIFCKVLNAKGFWNTNNVDFMKFKPEISYDLIIMNPPYKGKQLQTHLTKAISHLANNGELIAVVPVGLVNSIKEIDGFEDLVLLDEFNSVFEDTKINTALISVKK